MSSILRATLVVVAIFFWVPIASAWQATYFRSRNIHRTPITAIGLDKDDKLVIGGDWPMEFRRLSLQEDPTQKRGLLVVQIRGKDGNSGERFLAYPVNAGGSKNVRLVTEKGPGCFWTSAKLEEKKLLRELTGGDNRKIREIHVRREELFSVSEGTLKGQILCGDEDKSLVLRNSPSKRRVGSVVEFVYDDDPNDGK